MLEAPDPRVVPAVVRRYGRPGDKGSVETDAVACERPLEVRVRVGADEVPISVTMRTPGDDEVLAAGFLFTEGMIASRADLVSAGPADDARRPDAAGNVVVAVLREGVPFDVARFRRNVFTTSSCGVCGKGTLEALEVACAPLPPARPMIDDATLRSLPGLLRASQAAFARTGGLHATGLFAPDGSLRRLYEDVGRHNAMDKAIGASLLAGEVPLHETVALVSGRASFELVQKAARAGVPVLAAVGAPSSLAVSLATRTGMTLVGFLGEDGYNVYSGQERLASHTVGAA